MNPFTRYKKKEALDCKHMCVGSYSILSSWLWSRASALELTHKEWQLLFPWMVTLIHQSPILEDAGSLRPFSLVAGFLAAAALRVCMLSSVSFIQIHVE